MYKLTNANCVIKNGFLGIPMVDGNTDYEVYKQWLADGNTPEPADAPSQAELNAPHLAYLASTDWYVVRFAETGVAIPADILAARQAARDSIV